METAVDYLESMAVLDPRHFVESMETPEGHYCRHRIYMGPAPLHWKFPKAPKIGLQTDARACL